MMTFMDDEEYQDWESEDEEWEDDFDPGVDGYEDDY